MIGKTLRYALAPVAFAALVGSATVVSAEEINLSNRMLYQQYEFAPMAGDPDNPDLATAWHSYGIAFMEDGTFSHWYEGLVTLQFFGDGWGGPDLIYTWQWSGTYVFPDGDKLFVRGTGQNNAEGGFGTIEALGGTGAYANAVGAGDLFCFNPPNDPPGHPAMNRCHAENFVVTY